MERGRMLFRFVARSLESEIRTTSTSGSSAAAAAAATAAAAAAAFILALVRFAEKPARTILTVRPEGRLVYRIEPERETIFGIGRKVKYRSGVINFEGVLSRLDFGRS